MAIVRIAGIDPGYRNFGYFFGEYDTCKKAWVRQKWRCKDILGIKTYSLAAMKTRLMAWYRKYSCELSGVVVIEKQRTLRYVNIANYIATLVPHAIMQDVRPLKRHFGISAGSHYYNKKAAVAKYLHLLPSHTTFKQAHNKIDSYLLAMYYIETSADKLVFSNANSIEPSKHHVVKQEHQLLHEPTPLQGSFHRATAPR